VWKWLARRAIATNKKPEISDAPPQSNPVHMWMRPSFLTTPGWLEEARQSYKEGGMTDAEWQHTLRVADRIERQKAAEKLSEPL
jgi:hypothetical protein